MILVHGCFWHKHPDPECPLARLPKSRLDFWVPKLEGNRKRDKRNTEMLKKLGWEQLVIWECQLKNETTLTERVRHFLG